MSPGWGSGRCFATWPLHGPPIQNSPMVFCRVDASKDPRFLGRPRDEARLERRGPDRLS